MMTFDSSVPADLAAGKDRRRTLIGPFLGMPAAYFAAANLVDEPGF